MKYNVSALKCTSYKFSELSAIMEKSINLLGGINKFIQKGDKVLLKPNLLTSKDTEKACTTHPEFIRAVIKIIKKTGAHICLGDSPAFHSIQKVLKVSGIKKVCDEEKVPIVVFKEIKEIKNKDAFFVKSFHIAREVFQFNKIINLPKLKNHSLVQVTIALKNIFGVIPGLRKAQYHLRFPDPYLFSKMIIDLNMTIKPTLSIVDGIIGMEGEGPLSGTPRKVNVIVAGADSVSVDYICSQILGYNPLKILAINAAKEADFGGYSLDKINIKGDNLSNLQIPDFKKIKPTAATGQGLVPGIKNFIYKHIIVKKPVVKPNLCEGCQECVKICPAQAIAFINKKAKINYKKCIRCYCCSEICQFKAIKLTRFTI